jgi:hypothetical protein
LLAHHLAVVRIPHDTYDGYDSYSLVRTYFTYSR